MPFARLRGFTVFRFRGVCGFGVVLSGVWGFWVADVRFGGFWLRVA